LKWWIVVRFLCFISQLIPRKFLLAALTKAEQHAEVDRVRDQLMEMMKSWSWTFSQNTSVFLCSWIGISLLATWFIPETQLTRCLWWNCCWTGALIAFSQICCVYFLHGILNDDVLLDRPGMSGGVSLTPEQLDLHSNTIKKSDTDDFHQCDICFNPYENGEEIREFHNCGHHYHKCCLDPWMARKECRARCPLCQQRVDIKPEEQKKTD